MTLNIQELISGIPARLRYVIRYSTSRVLHHESVAEHSYFVGLYALMIGRWCRRQGLRISVEKLLTRATLHDLEEARSGDFPRPFKYSSPELRNLLETASELAYKQIMERILSGDPKGKAEQRELLDCWKSSKDDTMEGMILEFSDFLSVLGYMMHEGLANGNKIVEQHVADMDKYFSKFEQPWYDFIRPLIDQAAMMMVTLFNTRSQGALQI